MTTQESQTTFDVKVYFTVPDHLESENDCSEKMWQAFNKCDGLGLRPKWISEEFCDKMKPTKNDVFILDEFKGNLFEKLRNFKCSIVSPNCLLICFDNDEPIPEGNSPIYTTAMRGMCICASGLSPENKDQIQQWVQYMGGFFTKQLRNSVTHLVTDSVMSAKYESAIEMKIPIMTKDWIKAVWEANLNEVVKANNEIFDKYKCPVFMNLVVTSTNLSKRQKEEVKCLIHDHGGTFMGPLDGAKVRIVIASENGPLSDKLKYAMDNGIACLKINWVYESIKVGYALPFRHFLIKSSKASSTPEKRYSRITLNCSEISSIPHDKHYNNYVNETLSSTVSNFSTMEVVSNNLPGTSVSNVLDRLTFGKAKLAGPFLDGCNIYLAGFATSVRDKLNRILNVGSATRLDDISDAVTHVIVGDEDKASTELKMMKLRGLCPYVLSIEWLEESMKLKRPAQEEHFSLETKGGVPKKNVETPASPLSKKNLQMLQQPKRPPVPSFNLQKDITPDNEERQPDLVRQYLQETTTHNNTSQEFARPRTPISENKDPGNDDNVTNNSRPSILFETMQAKDPEKGTTSMDETYMVDRKLFQGLTFVVTGFDSNEDGSPEDTIVTLGGRVVSNSYTGIPDYGVVPVDGAPLKHTVNEIVTDLFIEDCINQKEIVDISYYHKPLSIRKPCSPLSRCVITMSMYTGMERKYLSALGTQLGAICQDIFSRKANAEKKVHGSTHLVCPTPEGNKYNAAVRWKLPAVTADWLKTCADQLTLVDETSFLVGETIAPDRSTLNSINGEVNPSNASESEMNMVEKTTTRNILTPKRHLSQIKNEDMSGDTPLINKRLSIVMNKTPQSPFHVSTPETPYGQVFKPDPSPDTRKGWVKWVNNFPDLQVTEPPLKRRAPSTPLSELKRQLWEKLKNPGQSEKENALSETPTTLNSDTLVEIATEKQDDNRSDKDSLLTPIQINRKLDFSQEDTPVSNKPNNEINMQIAQLDQVLQRTSSTPEKRYSLSGENAKKYDAEAPDHIQKFMVKDSQPADTIVWEDPSHSKRSRLDKETIEDNISEKDNDNISEKVEEPLRQDITAEYECEPSPIRKFMLSGVKDRNAYERVIRELGGDVSMDASFDNSATHLLCIRPSRNEKMLGSIASGKWVLHCSYLRDSEREGRFLDEEEYEWGNPKSKDTIPELNGEIERAIAAAAYRWRLKLLKKPNGPFSDMVALLLVAEEKYDQFKRLIVAGGGSVMQARPPYDTSPSGRKITHCFVNVRQVNQPIDWAMLASKGILCFLPQYLSDYLTATIPLSPRDCVLPEFKKYLTLLPK
ncbi:DNA topoisomerase 2-binding protein 1 isoform X2 [Odontomachus brunneus]|uniref:DNA topoisomerase 2-binding protein 1 isoform X2 n=1 Tax=Odontomachus brunneus TaxID=486640 RepID=UPI0013F1A8F6|nr:DNA topoisomerase 2-binding protein 1 isoform X2 [Odontomachus brunneus]